jgi:hypothetical protein
MIPVFSSAQDSNFLHSIEEIERKLLYEDFEVYRLHDLRYEGAISKRATLRFPGVKYMMVKWRRAYEGADDFNNNPRYETAAYEIQKLFLDENEFVVPPTLCRVFTLAQYLGIETEAEPTFRRPNVVLVLLQYWLSEVTDNDVFDKKRFRDDPLYAKHFANVNILTYLIKHADSNEGNLMISKDASNPRVFAVDNGVSFMSRVSDRGDMWSKLHVTKLPAKTIERLRQITPDDLNRALSVVAQFEIQTGPMKPIPGTESLDVEKGVRREGNIIQLGLTAKEISRVEKRLKDLLEKVDEGKYTLF